MLKNAKPAKTWRSSCKLRPTKQVTRRQVISSHSHCWQVSNQLPYSSCLPLVVPTIVNQPLRITSRFPQPRPGSFFLSSSKEILSSRAIERDSSIQKVMFFGPRKRSCHHLRTQLPLACLPAY